LSIIRGFMMNRYGRSPGLAGSALLLALLSIALLHATDSHAGEAYIKKMRGNILTIDKGAEAGLVTGMEVLIVRPPGEAVIHPVTGENLGSPEIEITTGEVTKTSARVASIVVRGRALLSIQPGDMVRFMTSEEEMVMDQERTMAREERAQQERRQIKSSVKDLTKNIRNTQGAINTLKSAISKLDRIDESIKVQLRGINEDIHLMKEEISALKESVSLMGAVPISEQEESSGTWIEDAENKEILEGIIRNVVDSELSKVPVAAAKPPPMMAEKKKLPPLDEGELSEEEEDEEASFMDQYGVFALIGVGALLLIGGILYYLKMNAGDDDDDEDDDDDDDDDEDDDEEEDFEVEEEDDIVVEETA
jgi:hypothetical protein